jgi:hypothetical protein
MPQGLEGAPRDNATHVCTSWCAEQLAAYELELAELRDHVAALRQDGRVGIEAWPSMSSEPTAQPTDLGDGAVSARGRSRGTRSGLPLLPRTSAVQAATALSTERAMSPDPSGLGKDSKGMSGERTKRALLQSGAYSPAAGGESALPCDKSEVGDIVASGDKERAPVLMKLSFSNPLCAACIFPCAAKPGFDPVLCAYGCHHQIENSCKPETGWERAWPLLDQVDLRRRDSLIRLMAVVQPPNAA